MPARLLAPAIAQIALCRAVVNIEAARFPVGRFDFALLTDGFAMAHVEDVAAFHESGGDVGRRGEFQLGFARCGQCEIAIGFGARGQQACRREYQRNREKVAHQIKTHFRVKEVPEP